MTVQAIPNQVDVNPPVVCLGSNTNFASHSSEDHRNWRNETVVNRYRLQDIARELLPLHRINICMKVPIIGTGRVEVWKDNETGHAHIKGVGRCGVFWVCPVCAAKITIGRRNELTDGMSKAREMGWYPVFVTYTARHSRDDTLLEMVKKTRQAQRDLKSGRWWQDNIKSHGLAGVITGIETTYGNENGWHVHYHALMFFDEFVSIKELEVQLFTRWVKALEGQGLDCDREHGVIVLPGNAAAAYITKWGIENEIVNPLHKEARQDHYTPFQLLQLYDQGEGWAGFLFKEFAAAFKGVSQLRWSKGLRDRLEMGASVSDQVLADEQTSKNSSLVVSMTWEQYKTLIQRGGRGVIGQLLMVSEIGDLAVFAWLLSFNILLDYG